MKEIVATGNKYDYKKLIPLLASLKAKFKELKRSDNEIVFLLQSEKDIDADVEESCDFSSAVQEMVAEIESLSTESQTKTGDEARRKSY